LNWLIAGRKVALISGVGFVMPIFWGMMELLAFNSRSDAVLTAIRVGGYMTCPPWLLPGIWGDVASPILNAILYGGVAWAVLFIRDFRHSKVKLN
jgi:hypothetical protein